MSRNFEMLQQAEQSRALFQSPVALPPQAPAQVVREQAEPEQREVEQHGKEERIRQGRSGNDHTKEVAKVPGGHESFSWVSWLRAGMKWLGIRSNGDRRHNRRSIDYKNISLQEGIKLVERVFLGPDSSSNRVILFSGIDRAEGGARICAQVAQTLAARVRGTICMVDADLNSRSLQQHLRVRNTAGLFEAAMQGTPIHRNAQPLGFHNLWMITSGGDGVNSRVVLNSERMRITFDELRRQFDYVLIHTPSMGTTANLTQFAQLADGVILVVDANCTRRETTKRFKESLEDLRVRVLGVVLNERTFPIPESVYRKL